MQVFLGGKSHHLKIGLHTLIPKLKNKKHTVIIKGSKGEGELILNSQKSQRCYCLILQVRQLQLRETKEVTEFTPPTVCRDRPPNCTLLVFPFFCTTATGIVITLRHRNRARTAGRVQTTDAARELTRELPER